MELDFESDVSDTSGFTSESRFQRHYRSGRYKRPQSSRSGVKATLLDQPICAIDGEGKSRPDGSHDYTQFCASWPDGRTMIEAESISSEQCLRFLLDLPEHHTYIGYGLSYDTNMWLRDLAKARINCQCGHKYIADHLLDKGSVRWKSYTIRMIERKFFTVKRGSRSVTVYDVLANWQVSFVKACVAWDIGTPAELELVRRMKEKRGSFDAESDADISQYCFLECDLLRQLARKLFDAILRTPYRPNAVYGPGALASAAMRKHGISKYMAELPEQIDYLSQKAYFGGRFDCAMFGWFQDVWQYDIKSAYPDQIRFLPCLAHATWRPVKRKRKRIIPQRYGLYHVEWRIPANSAWTPFPHRERKGNVFYPYEGAGWYHGDEILAATELYGPRAVHITNGYDLVQNCDHRPFDFVDELFEIRKSLPYDQGVVFKLILNSIYGKLAQQVGTHGDKKPRFQCFYWAGAITAGTRAKILRNLKQSPESIIGIATDSLVSLRKLDVDEGAELGQWDFKQLSEYAQISNGVYNAVDMEGKQIERSRGLGRSVLNWDKVKRDYTKSRGCGTHHFAGRIRFITIREARNRTDRATIQCRWIGEQRKLNFWPTRRWPEHYSKRGPFMRLTPLSPDDYGADWESQPFRLKTDSQEVIDARLKYNVYGWQDFE